MRLNPRVVSTHTNVVAEASAKDCSTSCSLSDIVLNRYRPNSYSRVCIFIDVVPLKDTCKAKHNGFECFENETIAGS